MDVRVTQYGSETETGSYELPEQHSSDSSFEIHMAERMAAEQRQTRRAPLNTRRHVNIPLDVFNRRSKAEIEAQTVAAYQGPLFAPQTRPAQPQKRRLNLPLEDFERGPKPRIRNGTQNQGNQRARQIKRNENAAPQPVVEVPGLVAGQSLFERYQHIKNQATPIVRELDTIDWDDGADNPIPSIEDSPLSRKSSTRGTPATGRFARNKSVEKVLSWEVSDEFDDKSLISSTPAYPTKRRIFGKAQGAETVQTDPKISRQAGPTTAYSARLDAIRRADAEAAQKELEEEKTRRRNADEQMNTALTEDGITNPPNRKPTLEEIFSASELDALGPLAELLTDSEVDDAATITGPLQTASGFVPHPSDHRQPGILSRPGNNDLSRRPIARQMSQAQSRSNQLPPKNPPKSQLNNPPRPVSVTSSYPTPPLDPIASDQTSLKPRSTYASPRKKIRDQGPSTTNDSVPSPVATPGPSRFQADQSDSIDILRQLSRSVTPKKPHNDMFKPPSQLETVKPSSSRVTSTAGRHNAIDEVFASARKTSQPRTNAGSQNSLGNSDIPPPLPPKTPLVTGAWIETPAAERQSLPATKASKKPTPVALPKQPAVQSSEEAAKQKKPDVPKSALSALVGRARKETGQSDELGDSTIDSLEGLMSEEDDDNTARVWDFSKLNGVTSPEERTTTGQATSSSNGSSDSTRPTTKPSDTNRRLAQLKAEVDAGSLTPRRKGRLEEEMHLQRMSEHVNNMHSRTKSLNAGLGRLERTLEKSANCTHHKCDGDCLASHPFSALARGVRETFYTVDEDNKGHMTPLGWISLLFATWAICEIILCFVLTRPLFRSYTHSSYGPFPASNSPPFLVLTSLSNAASFLTQPIHDPITAFWHWISSSFVYWFGSSDGARGDYIGKASKAFSSTATRLARQTFVAGEYDFSMDKDEVML
ncbi:hypothetical protein BT63DRAFT_482484 [Microthyrium microscopicum]|uniref:Uncharacterized protein n=1 Tax=Microthyrium microscopicum TaxID=703497 RepID=A0A6A6U0T8_9PEZI|nr:hypothetical protein BT63DRAFT_482484 [Microthyrium microscopicum]